MKILVTGASGFIGSALIEYLSNIRGVSVVGMVRSLPETTYHSLVEYRVGKIGWPEKLSINLSDIDVVVHAAGRAHIMKDSAANPIEEFRRVNTQGTIELAKIAADAGVKRFIFLSSIKVNGDSTNAGFPFSKVSTEDPRDAYGISKYEAELGLRKISLATGLEVTIIRPSLVYGSGVKGNFSALIKILSLRLPLPLGLVNSNLRSMVSLDNLINLIDLCVRHPKAANQTFLVSDNSDVSTCSLLRLLGSSIGKPAILINFPRASLILVSKLFGMEARAQRILGTLQVDISHTCIELGWEPPYTVEDSLNKLGEHLK